MASRDPSERVLKYIEIQDQYVYADLTTRKSILNAMEVMWQNMDDEEIADLALIQAEMFT